MREIESLPESWVKIKLKDAVDIHDYERKPINSSERADRINGKSQKDLFPYYGATGQVGWIDEYLSSEESVLLGEDGAPFLDPNKDKAYIVRGKFWVNNHAHILRGTHNLVDNRFICHQLNIINYRDFVSGSTRLKLTKSALEKLPLVICSEKEQIRIVEKLEELLSDLDNGVAELKKAQNKLGLYRQSLLKSAVEGQLTAQWREQNRDTITETGQQLLERILKERRQRWEEQKLAEFAEKGKKPPKNWQAKYPEPVVPDTSNLPELPKGWVWASIDQLALNKRYGSSSKTNDDPTGVPVLRMGNIQDGELDYNNLKYLPVDHNEFPGLFLRDGDLLFNRTNSAELVGKTAIYRDIGKSCSYASYLIAVTFTDRFNPELAAYFINSAFGKAWIGSVMNQTAGQANVNGTKLGALAIPLPPSAEQTVIVDQVTALQERLNQQAIATETGIKQAAAQRKNILKDAFSGKLVPQNPDDEPASALLEKIKAERAEKAKQPKPKRPRKQKAKVITMETLLDVLKSEKGYIDAQEAFKRCGVTDGTDTDTIERLYAELRKLDKAGQVDIKRVGDFDQIKLKDVS